MKAFIKPFLLSFVGFTLLFSGFFIGMDFLNHNKEGVSLPQIKMGSSDKNKKIDQYVKNKKRLNILLLGADGGRSDTMMVLSIDLANQGLKLLSIPRDTYYHVEGYDAIDQRKINAVYGHGKGKGGALGVQAAVQDLTKLEIPYYVEVDYDAVMEIVDLLGGVDFEVPFDMNYDDPYAKPPLHIHLKKGMQTLDGEKAMQLIRWRKNNGSEGTGDIDRTKRQQAFMTAAAKKAFGLKLPMVIKTAYDNVNTNISVTDLMYLGTKLVGMDLDKIERHTLPGEVGSKKGYSFLLPDEAAIEALRDAFTNIVEPAKKE